MLHQRERALLLANPDLFCLTYFPHKFRPHPDTHARLEDFHLRLIKTATTQPRSLILYPAGHGKTTLVSTALPIWAACADPNVRVAIIAKNDQDGVGIGQAIQAELLGNDELIRDFGPFEPYPEQKLPFAFSKMSVRRRTRRAKEPTIAIFGAQSRSALGHRTDWMICDDIVHDQNSATTEQREKIREWFNQGPATSGEHLNSRLTVVGTRFDPQDLYAELEELDSYHVQHEDAIVEMCGCKHPALDHAKDAAGHPVGGCGRCRCEEFDPDPESDATLWVERWPWARLMYRKLEMGTLDFNKRYRNIAVDKSRMAFREEYIKGGSIGKAEFPGCLDKHYIVGEYEPSWRRFAGFDPAVGLTRSRKFCAHATLGLGSCRDHERCFWIIDLEREQMTLPQQVDLAIVKHQHYDLFETNIEANSYQLGLFQAIKSKMDDLQIALKMEPHYTSRINKPDPEMGVASMARFFENGWFHIPWGNPESRRKMQQLVDELVQFPAGKYSDTVMALWIAWRRAQEGVPRFSSFSYLPKVAPTLARRTRRRTVLNPYYERSG